MDWNGGSLRQPYNVTRPDSSSSFNFLYNSYNYDHYSGVDVKHQGMGEATTGMNNFIPGGMDHKMSYGSSCNDHKKKRLTTDQLESLERSFQEDIKLDPDRKMKLSRELGLQPRQIAVWFQNRRARWKAKQLERLYDALKQEFDTVSKEKHKLQEEVIILKAVMRERGTRKQASTGYTDMSGEETVESTSVGAIWGTNKQQHQQPPRGIIGEGNYLLNADEYATVIPVSSPCWPLLPSYP